MSPKLLLILPRGGEALVLGCSFIMPGDNFGAHITVSTRTLLIRHAMMMGLGYPGLDLDPKTVTREVEGKEGTELL